MTNLDWFEAERLRDFVKVAEGRLAEEEYWRRYWCALQQVLILWGFGEVSSETFHPVLQVLVDDCSCDVARGHYGFLLSAQDAFAVAEKRKWVREAYVPACRALVKAIAAGRVTNGTDAVAIHDVIVRRLEAGRRSSRRTARDQ